jgi:hypothetical protein
VTFATQPDVVDNARRRPTTPDDARAFDAIIVVTPA